MGVVVVVVVAHSQHSSEAFCLFAGGAVEAGDIAVSSVTTVIK